MEKGDGKVMEQGILEVISIHVEEKRVLRSSQHGLRKGKSCLTNPTVFYDTVAGWVDKRRAVHVCYLEFSKAFGTDSCNILVDKLRNCGLDE